MQLKDPLWPHVITLMVQIITTSNQDVVSMMNARGWAFIFDCLKGPKVPDILRSSALEIVARSGDQNIPEWRQSLLPEKAVLSDIASRTDAVLSARIKRALYGEEKEGK